MRPIDWNSTNNRILINPRFPEEEKRQVMQWLESGPPLKDHFWIATSGSTGQMKWTALSKEAILCSANAVNVFLDCDNKDVWLNPLPTFHVGGLGILARAFLTGSKVINAHEKWNVDRYFHVLEKSKATLISLVPAQVYDLIKAERTAPESLRGVIVGGGALSEEIYHRGKELGWPLLPSYGLTECASQVATASNKNAKMRLLPHIEARINEKGYLAIKSPSLLTLYAINAEFIDPKKDGWFETEDLAEIKDGEIIIKGRKNNFIKIGGESVDILRLEGILEAIKIENKFGFDMALIPFPDTRLGHVINLVIEKSAQGNCLKVLLDEFNKRVLPFEKIRQIHYIEQIPKTDLGKVKIMDLIRQIWT